MNPDFFKQEKGFALSVRLEAKGRGLATELVGACGHRWKAGAARPRLPPPAPHRRRSSASFPDPDNFTSLHLVCIYNLSHTQDRNRGGSRVSFLLPVSE